MRKSNKKTQTAPGEKKLLAALCIFAALTLVLPSALWPFSAPLVAQSGTFTQPFPTPVPGAILLGCTLLGVFLTNKKTLSAPQTEDGGEAE